MAKKPKPSPKPRRSSVALSAPMSDQPWWVKTIVWVGVPTAGCAYLLYFVLGALTSRLDNLTTTLGQHQADSSKLIQHLTQETDQAWVTLGVMQRICLNTAKTGEDRVACVSIAARRGQ